jgi:hypothetical protein
VPFKASNAREFFRKLCLSRLTLRFGNGKPNNGHRNRLLVFSSFARRGFSIYPMFFSLASALDCILAPLCA